MDTLEIIIRFISGILLILINALFVLTEFGLTRLRQFDREEIEDNDALNMGWKMTEELEIYLTSCQLGISATSVILGVVFEPAVTVLLEPVFQLFGVGNQMAHSISIVVGLVIINLVHQVWGEQAPTYFGVEKPLKAIKMGVRFLYWWTKLLYPLILLGDGLSKWTLRVFGVNMTRSWVDEEMEDGDSVQTSSDSVRAGVRKTMIELLKKKSDLSGERAEEVIRSYDIGEKPARDIMIELDDTVKLSTTDGFEEAIVKIERGGHSRYPLFDGEGGAYLGNIYLPSVLSHYDALKNDRKKMADIAVGKMTRNIDIKISQLIDAFQEEDQELCLLENDEGIRGMVTFTDACEAVFGELEDPLD